MTLSIRRIVTRALVAALAAHPIAASAQMRYSQRPNTPSGLGIHGFSVVLVVGSLGSTSAAAGDTVPEVARKALADMKDFLPYKRYQLLDAAWMLCCASSRTGISGRVRGLEDREYRYDVDPITVTNAKLDVRFTIRELTDLIPVKSGQQNEREGLGADRSREAAARRAYEQGRSPSGNIIDSTFSISLGETVVVGTSRLNGDRALIALLTAVGKPAPGR